MRIRGKIITVGLCPCWDMVCRLEGIDWGQHKVVSSCVNQPAGKALNISRALAWMGETSIAAGLWGNNDYEQMLGAMSALRERVKVRMTAADGSTRRNITVVDTVNAREMHLRNRSELASTKALRRLQTDLGAIVRRGSVCVFAGAVPESELVRDVIRIIRSCSRRGAKIALDMSGSALKQIVGAGMAWLIKPNVEELRGLLAGPVKDTPVNLARAGRKLLDKVEVVLISRGERGAVVVTKEGAWQSRCIGKARVSSTVGCGDYLLAGFLKGLTDESDVPSALETAIQVATAKAWGWTENRPCSRALRGVKTATARL